MSEEGDVEGSRGGDSSSDDSPVPVPEVPMDILEEGQEGKDEHGEEEMQEDEKVEVDLKAMADDYAKYLVVDSPKDQTALHDRIDGVYTRVEEFKQQLYFLHQNITSNSDKMQELQDNSDQLTALFQKIDQMEAFLSVVNSNVDQLEEAVSQAEKDLEPSKIRKVFTSFGFGKKSTSSQSEPSKKWNPPRLFHSKDYFPHKSEPASPAPTAISAPTSGQAEDTTSSS